MLLLENIDHDQLKKYMKEFYSYASKELDLDRPPKIVFKRDQKNADDVFGKTGFYDPDSELIALFINDRHAKDVLRSFAHELIHHQQKCRGADKGIDLSLTAHDPAYASHDLKLREMEREAFERGNMLFRDWCDMKKMERGNLMENKKLDEKEMSKKDIKKAHEIGKAVEKSGSAKEPFAVGMAKMKGKKEMDEAAKPDFLDLDGDGNKKEPMKKAAKDAKKDAKRLHKAQNGEDLKEDDTYGAPEAVEALEENFSHPYPELFKKKERLNNERQTQYEQWIYEEMLKRAIK